MRDPRSHPLTGASRVDRRAGCDSSGCTHRSEALEITPRSDLPWINVKCCKGYRWSRLTWSECITVPMGWEVFLEEVRLGSTLNYRWEKLGRRGPGRGGGG